LKPNKFFTVAFSDSPTDFMDYRAAKQFIVAKLRTELSQALHYHGLHHTLDVLKMAAEIGDREGVSPHNLVLLKTAALFHDAGFVKNKHAGHEAEGCLIARAALPGFGYGQSDIETICGMIMATKIPQSPNTLLEEIICDADLDYLGRGDFYTIGDSLFEEMQAYHLIGDEYAWNRLQVSFLNGHRFHTRTNKLLREPVKQRYLEELRGVVAAY
jgi:HD superfamily phosphodiesterase